MKIYCITEVLENTEGNYTDVAHLEWDKNPKNENIEGKFIWAWVKGELQVVPFWHPVHTAHDCYWETEFKQHLVPYAGRFDAATNILSISSPPNSMASFREIPQYVEQKLRSKFGQDIIIKRYK